MADVPKNTNILWISAALLPSFLHRHGVFITVILSLLSSQVSGVEEEEEGYSCHSYPGQEATHPDLQTELLCHLEIKRLHICS